MRQQVEAAILPCRQGGCPGLRGIRPTGLYGVRMRVAHAHALRLRVCPCAMHRGGCPCQRPALQVQCSAALVQRGAPLAPRAGARGLLVTRVIAGPGALPSHAKA